jgi:phage FluMu protein gp41
MPGLIGDIMRPGQAAAGQEGDAQSPGIRTEYPFVLPRGYVDERGVIHRDGVMRLATARDEITTQTDPRVRQNPAYLTVLLLSRTITRIGQVNQPDTLVIENLFASDLAFLQDLYRRINQEGHTEVAVDCPSCGHSFTVDVAGDAAGES